MVSTVLDPRLIYDILIKYIFQKRKNNNKKNGKQRITVPDIRGPPIVCAYQAFII
jgi:hypothetical protein